MRRGGEGSTTIPGGGVGTLCRSGRGSPIVGDRDIVLFLALKDSDGNIVIDDVYTGGSYKDIHRYTQIGKTLYPAGNKFTVLAYSKLAEKVYKAGSQVTLPGYVVYTGELYLPGSTITVNDYASASGYYKSAGSTTAYLGDGASGNLAGTKVTGTNQGNQVTTDLYRTSTASNASYEKVIRHTSYKYYGGNAYTLYKNDGSYVVGRGTQVTHLLREAYPTTGLYTYSGQSQYTLLGTLVNGSGGTTFYTRDAEKDTKHTTIGAEVTAYERDEDGDYEVTPISPTVSYSKTFTESEDTERLYALGKKCTFTPAEVKTQEVTTLTT